MPKNLHYHKKQLKQHRARNRFQQWADAAIESIFAKVCEDSDKRWEQLKTNLQLQRCNSINHGKA